MASRSNGSTSMRPAANCSLIFRNCLLTPRRFDAYLRCMAVLSDRNIKEQLAAGRILVEPLDRDAIQPASVDLRLDSSFRVFNVTTRPYIDVREPVDDLTLLVTIAAGEPFIVQPGVFCLATTLETITLPDDI